MQMKTQKGKLLALFLVMAVIIVLIGPKPLIKLLGAEQMNSGIQAELICPTPIEQENGGIIYERVITELDAKAGSEAAQELYKAMSEIYAIGRWRLPFKNVLIYSTNHDSLSITFSIDGNTVDLMLLSGSHTIYDFGVRSQQFYVKGDTFKQLSTIIEKYGVSRVAD